MEDFGIRQFHKAHLSLPESSLNLCQIAVSLFMDLPEPQLF